MTEHIHMFHLPKILDEDPKSVSPEPPTEAVLQSEPQAHSGCLAAQGEQGSPGIPRVPKEAHQ